RHRLRRIAAQPLGGWPFAGAVQKKSVLRRLDLPRLTARHLNGSGQPTTPLGSVLGAFTFGPILWPALPVHRLRCRLPFSLVDVACVADRAAVFNQRREQVSIFTRRQDLLEKVSPRLSLPSRQSRVLNIAYAACALVGMALHVLIFRPGYM